MEMTDGSENVVNSYRYKAFGQALSSSSQVTNEYRYTARRWDGVASLQFNRNRYYQRNYGRWSQWDPIRYRNDLNLYRYVKNSPSNAIDSFGLLQMGSPHSPNKGQPGMGPPGDPNSGFEDNPNTGGGPSLRPPEEGLNSNPVLDFLDCIGNCGISMPVVFTVSCDSAIAGQFPAGLPDPCTVGTCIVTITCSRYCLLKSF